MERRKRIIPGLMVLSGLLIFAYPFVGNFVNRRHATVAVERVREEALESGKTASSESEESASSESGESAAGSVAGPVAEESAGELVAGESVGEPIAQGEALGILHIPAIDLELPVYEGCGEDILARGIGHIPETDLPMGGAGTHTALSGHRGLGEAEFFVNLDMVQEGDTFTIEALGDLLTYEVDRISVVEPRETEMLAVEPGEDLCTLITCTPRGINSHRLLVRGRRVFGEVQEERQAPADLHWKSGWRRLGDLWTWLALAVILILGAEALWFMHRNRSTSSEGGGDEEK